SAAEAAGERRREGGLGLQAGPGFAGQVAEHGDRGLHGRDHASDAAGGNIGEQRAAGARLHHAVEPGGDLDERGRLEDHLAVHFTVNERLEAGEALHHGGAVHPQRRDLRLELALRLRVDVGGEREAHLDVRRGALDVRAGLSRGLCLAICRSLARRRRTGRRRRALALARAFAGALAAAFGLGRALGAATLDQALAGARSRALGGGVELAGAGAFTVALTGALSLS